MNELSEIVRAWRRSAAAGRPAVLATVVEVNGSAYRRPGARMLFPADGAAVGLVSGGCLEADLAERANEVLSAGAARTVVYDMRSPDDIVWGLGLGCDGEVRVLLERLDPAQAPVWLDTLERAAAQRRAAALLTVIGGDGAQPLGTRWLVEGPDERPSGPEIPAGWRETLDAAARRAFAEQRSADVSVEATRLLVEFVPPPIALVLFGAGLDAVPMVRIAAELGWPVTVVDRRDDAARASRFPGARVLRRSLARLDVSDLALDRRAAAVIMTHHFLDDVSIVRRLLPTEVGYIGCLGPARRFANLRRELERDTPGLSDRRLHGPVGLDIGAETPAEIALAVAAELRAVLAGRAGGSLRERRSALHERAR